MSNGYLFEVSWEVCNKVGGIYTVLTSKVKEALNEFNDCYFTLGPKLQRNQGFIPSETDEFSEAIKRLAAKNIYVQNGVWDIPGKPKCLIVDFQKAYPQPDKLLYELWTEYGVDSMFGGWDYVEPVLFSTVCGIVISEIVKDIDKKNNFYAHFHEWMTGAGLLYLKKHAPFVSTILTTHATMLGRAMSGSGTDIYTKLENINPQLEAKLHNVTAKHSMETVSAREADCFVTVSQITSLEAKTLLGTPPAIVTPNGFNVDSYPDYSVEVNKRNELRNKLLQFISSFLEKNLESDKTLIFATSGRYEFHNKGIDILIESLSRLNTELKKQNPKGLTIVSLFLVIGGYAWLTEEARIRLTQPSQELVKFAGISTHHLGDSQHDPIVNACQRLNLVNNPEDPCKVILIPVYLDGNDGILNMEYYDVITGCDLTVFPSFYEPWGYTPLESTVFSVPTITTDRTGFGQWVKNTMNETSTGVFILPRIGKNDESTIQNLTSKLYEVTQWSKEDWLKQREASRKIALNTSWKDFYNFYKEAYEKSNSVKQERITGIQRLQEIQGYQTVYSGTNSTQPRLRTISIITDLPNKLNRLRELVYNLWWVWNNRAQKLFIRLDPVLWEKCYHNPVAMLDVVDKDKIDAFIRNKHFMSLYKDVFEEFDNYISTTTSSLDNLKNITKENPVAYFSMEFGLHESIRTYSGGLGILSGDHIKSASDLNLPLVGVSLLYKYGYFRQTIGKNGEQIANFVESNYAQLPIDTVETEKDERFLISVDFPGRKVYAQVWKANVGRSKLYLLETDIEENARADRDITSRLYEPTSRERIEQEIILGIGGVRLLSALGIKPSIYHLNEGHSAFLLIERIRQLMKQEGLDYSTAKEYVKGSTVFTMHTPVPAGNERFDKSLVENYFKSYINEMDIPWEEFWNLGHVFAEDPSSFTMTVLALKLSCLRNGVSKLHGSVSRKMWQNVWSGFLLDEIPINYITNGVHVATWMSDDIRRLIETFTTINIEKSLTESEPWVMIDEIPDTNLWQTHKFLKDQLVELIKNIIQNNWTKIGEANDLIEKFYINFNPSALTICFARRFATYKRPLLIFEDIERLKKILNNKNHPVQFIFAGKAHPADKEGADLITKIVQLSKQDEFIGKIFFLESYNISMAKSLVAGVDVWLNNPVRPMEASGTSGMKAAINGVINCSILDGWWDESYNSLNGWAIGSGENFENPTTQNRIDSNNLYTLLEEKIIPTFYNRNNQNLPEQWIKMMKNSMKSVIPHFNTHRMLKNYVTDMYEPTAAITKTLGEKNCKNARELAEWKKKIPLRFSALKIQDVRVDGLHGDVIKLDTPLNVSVRIQSSQIPPDELIVELITINETKEGKIKCTPMKLIKKDGDILYYQGSYKSEKTGTCQYGIRVLPCYPSLCAKYEPGLVYWS
jgi:glycogen phosphorylase/synthase